MKKKAVISLRSFNDLDKDDVIEVVTPGEFFVTEDGFKAVYEETEISGMNGTTTTLTMLNDALLLEREGSTSAKMDFKKGETSISLYNTPYGVLDLQIHTEYLEVTSMLSRENFPDKVYGDLVFPQGEYEAYRILIGEAKGQNWWCVMFPPLCFVDGTKDAVDSKEIEKKISEGKAKDENDIKSTTKNKNKKAEIKFKSKIFEFLFKDKEK